MSPWAQTLDDFDEMVDDMVLSLLERSLCRIGKNGHTRRQANDDADHFRAFLERRRGKTHEQLRLESRMKRAASKARAKVWRDHCWPDESIEAAEAARAVRQAELKAMENGSRHVLRTFSTGEPAYDHLYEDSSQYIARLHEWHRGARRPLQ